MKFDFNSLKSLITGTKGRVKELEHIAMERDLTFEEAVEYAMRIGSIKRGPFDERFAYKHFNR